MYNQPQPQKDSRDKNKFHMTDVLFNRIFAPKKDKNLQEDLKYKFDLDLKRLYG